MTPRLLYIFAITIVGVMIAAWLIHEGATIAALFLCGGIAAAVRWIDRRGRA